ncbi:MAG TPA: hypothetical protein VFV38_37670 [Ktedonobacteraceae bacterium]|nr:hypothetical protein [Ktedonobacteraceae bacterium]
MSSSVTSIAQWQERVRKLLSELSTSQGNVLEMLSYATILTRSSGLTRITTGLAQVEQVPVGRLLQRLREFYYEAAAKRGNKRREIDVQACFPALLQGVLMNWQGPHELVLAMDTSTLGNRFVTLNLSVMYRGCSIPIAWAMLPAREKGEWKAHWLRLLQAVGDVIPADWRVLVMADRRLSALWLYQAIVDQGWHPFLRVKENLTFRAASEAEFHPLRERVARHGRSWQGQGEWSEQGEQIAGTLLVVWKKGYEDRLAVVTDLLPGQAQAAWYQIRFWIEDEYQDHQRGGFHWEHTKMADPGSAERLYLVMVGSMQLAVMVGGSLEAREQQEQQRQAKTRVSKGRKWSPGQPARAVSWQRGREQSCLSCGCQAISAAALRAEEIPSRVLAVEPWPTQRPALGNGISGWIKRRKRKPQGKSQAQLRPEVQAFRRAHAREQASQQQHRKAARETERQWKEQHQEECQRWHEECAQCVSSFMWIVSNIERNANAGMKKWYAIERIVLLAHKHGPHDAPIPLLRFFR